MNVQMVGATKPEVGEVQFALYDGWLEPDEVSSVAPTDYLPDYSSSDVSTRWKVPEGEAASTVHMKNGVFHYLPGTPREIALRLKLSLW